MTVRPYFKSSVAELEHLFDEKRGDRQFLAALAAELKFRETQRAKALMSRVVACLGTVAAKPLEPAAGLPGERPIGRAV